MLLDETVSPSTAFRRLITRCEKLFSESDTTNKRVRPLAQISSVQFSDFIVDKVNSDTTRTTKTANTAVRSSGRAELSVDAGRLLMTAPTERLPVVVPYISM